MSYKHVSLWCLFRSLHPTAHHWNISVQLTWVSELGLLTLDQEKKRQWLGVVVFEIECWAKSNL